MIFFVQNNCGASLAPHSSCTLGVTFKPVAAGTKYAKIVVTDNAGSSPQSATLTGIGIQQPYATLSAVREIFPSTAVGSTSAALILTVTNTAVGGYELRFKSFTMTGESDDFVFTNNCLNAYLVPNASCTIIINFKPVSTGTKLATLVITDNAAVSSRSVTLTGTAR